MRCAEARKGKEMKAEERRLVRRRSMYAAALLCVFCLLRCLGTSQVVTRPLPSPSSRPCAPLARRTTQSPSHRAQHITTASVRVHSAVLGKRATEGRCVPLSTPLVLKVLCIRYWRQWLLAITRSRTGRRTVAAAAAFRFASQGKAKPHLMAHDEQPLHQSLERHLKPVELQSIVPLHSQAQQHSRRYWAGY
jgi:hypothetical protein